MYERSTLNHYCTLNGHIGIVTVLRLTESPHGVFMFSSSSDTTVQVKAAHYFPSIFTLCTLSTGMEPGEHATHTGSSKTRETHPSSSHLPGLCLHWIRGHGNQGQFYHHYFKSHSPNHPIPLSFSLRRFSDISSYDHTHSLDLSSLSLSNLTTFHTMYCTLGRVSIR